jgi:hypothetical protein
VYWIVNLVETLVELYTEPTGPGVAPTYRQRRNLGPDDMIPLAIDGREVGQVAVRDLLP